MKTISLLLIGFLMMSDVSGLDYRLQNDSLARIQTLADAKVKKDERVAIEIFECDSCLSHFGFKGGTERRTFYDSEGFLIALHVCEGNGVIDRVEKYYFDEFGNEIRQEYLDQKTGQSNASGRIRKGASWIFWRSTNVDTNYFEVDYSINKIEPDEYINSRLHKTIRNTYDAKGRAIEKNETTHLASDTVPVRSQSYQGPGLNRNEYVVDSTFRHTNGNQQITYSTYNENGNLIKEVEIKQYELVTKVVSYIIDNLSKTVIKEKIKSELYDTTKYKRITGITYKDGEVVIQRDSIGKLFKGSFSGQVTERRKQYRKHKIVKDEYWEIYPDKNSFQRQITHRYDRFGNEIFTKNKAVGKKNDYEIRRWKYTQDSLLIKARTYRKYFNEKAQKNISRIEFKLLNKYSGSGKLIYSKLMNSTGLIGLRETSSRFPLKEKTWITETERFYYPDSIFEIKKEYGIKKNYTGKTESLFTEKRELIKSEEVDVINHDRYVKERIIVNENTTMYTEKLNDTLLNKSTYVVLKYP